MEEQNKEHNISPLMLTPEEIEDLREDLHQAAQWMRAELAKQNSKPDTQDR